MKIGALAAAVAIVGADAQAAPLTQTDFRQLMEAAASAGASSPQPDTKTICVQRELETPLKFSRGAMEATHTSGIAGLPMTKLPNPEESAVEKAFAFALSQKVAAEASGEIPSLPPKFVLYSSASPVPARCAIDHRVVSASTNHAITLTLTQPVLAGGFVFIDQTMDCAGLCGSGWLRVFRKQNGRWQQIAYRNLFMS